MTSCVDHAPFVAVSTPLPQSLVLWEEGGWQGSGGGEREGLLKEREPEEQLRSVERRREGGEEGEREGRRGRGKEGGREGGGGEGGEEGGEEGEREGGRI